MFSHQIINNSRANLSITNKQETFLLHEFTPFNIANLKIHFLNTLLPAGDFLLNIPNAGRVSWKTTEKNLFKRFRNGLGTK